MSTNNKISNLISSQVPFFVRNDHPNFVAFLEAYYEYLEQEGITLAEGKVVERSKNLLNYMDIDKTLTDFTEKLYQHFMQSIPRDVIVDRTLLLKHIKDFYMARGTEKAARFLIRILFNEELEFYYPKQDVLRSSDGKWYIEKYINISNTAVNNIANSDIVHVEKFINTKIHGMSSNTTAVVDKIIRVVDSGQTIDQLYLSSILGSFTAGEKLYAKSTANGNTVFLTTNILDNSISSIVITNRGSLYNVGDPILIDSNTGNNANIIVSAVSRGEVIDAVLNFGGAGFKLADPLDIISSTGTNATGSIILVSDDNYYHPNTYNIIYSTIGLEANTTIGNTVYSNLNLANVNTAIFNAVNTFAITGLGPILSVQIGSGGYGYVTPPVIDARSNTLLKQLGILGRMSIVRGGTGYQIDDTIDFVNPVNTYGFGAKANVTNVSGSGAITEVKFVKYNLEPIGGTGYSANNLPSTVINSANGSGAIIKVTAVLGDNDNITALSDVFGAIKETQIIASGNGYSVPATANLKASGDGKARGYAVVAKGFNPVAGRYLNDDGFLSSYNFLQDKDFYQNYSYLVVVKKSLSEYRDAFKNLLHPAGMKLFGEFDYLPTDTSSLPFPSVNVTAVTSNTTATRLGTFAYTAGGSVMKIVLSSHGFIANDNVYIDFIDTSGYNSSTYFITNANTNQFNVTVSSISTNYSGKAIVYTTAL